MTLENTSGRDKTALLSKSSDATHNIIGLGGGCHWCTEGVFESLKGVLKVNQGWIASLEDNQGYSEAIEVIFDESKILQHDLINIHLHTHASTSEHSMREKYRSAVYVYTDEQFELAGKSLTELASEFSDPLVTKVQRFASFKPNKAMFQSYFYSSPTRPFCQSYIHPKLRILLAKFSTHLNTDKLSQARIKL